MTPSLASALNQIRNDITAVLAPANLRQLCSQVGHSWRQRALDPITTIHLFVLQILHRNTACAHLPRITGRAFSASAYCQARARWPLALLERLLDALVAATKPLANSDRWRGHRTWLADGTGVSLPDTPALQRAFGQPTNQTPGGGFPVARILALFHAGTGLMTKILVTPLRSHEAVHVTGMHPALEPGDVLVGEPCSANGCRTCSPTPARPYDSPTPTAPWDWPSAAKRDPDCATASPFRPVRTRSYVASKTKSQIPLPPRESWGSTTSRFVRAIPTAPS